MKQFEEFPVVKDYESKDKAKILQYIYLAYGKDSKLNSIDNLPDRKQKAFETTGLKDKDILLMKNEKVNELIFAYLGPFLMDNEYYNFITDQKLYWQMQDKLMTAVQQDANEDEEIILKRFNLRLALSEAGEKLHAKIAIKKQKIFGGKEEITVAEDQIRKDIVMKRPEDRVKRSM